MIRREDGSAPVDSLFAILLVLLLALGAIQVGLSLYARNVVLSAAHEGARAAVELGRDEHDAQAIAARTIRQAAGGLVRELEVATAIAELPAPTVTVRVSAMARALGPIPIAIPVRAQATARRDVVVP